MENNKGRFIVFEGLDGSGISTQVENARNFLIKKGFNVLATKEPTADSDAGRKIKKILNEKTEIDSLEFQKLYVQDRKEHLEQKVIPALESGRIVISDRYFFSTFAFGTAHGAKLEDLIELNKDFPYPDIILYLKVSARTSIERIKKRGSSKEFFEREDMLERVGKVYDTFSEKFKNFKIINAERSKEEVFDEIKKYV